MPIAYFVVAGLAALFLLVAGFPKLLSAKDALKARGMDFVEDFAGWQVKLIGAAEIVGAVGLIVPMATRIAPVLSPVAALCVVVIMVGAIVVHLRRGDAPKSMGGSIVGLALSAASAVLGFLAL